MYSLIKAALSTAFSIGIAAAQSPGLAQTSNDYPSKPIRFIVGSMAGGAADNIARAIAQKLSGAWGQQVIVDNRGGAAGAVALDLAAKAPADGYTILLISTNQTVDAAVNPKRPYDLTNDFTAISQAASFFYMMYHNPAVRVSSVNELIAHAKRNPGKLNYGTPGAASMQHLAWEMFGHMAGINLVHVPYKGGAHAITAAISGDVQIGFGTLVSLRPHVSAGRLGLLAFTANKRSPEAPDIPTVAEAGVPGFEAGAWYGVVTKAKAQPAIIKKLNAGIVDAIRSPDLVRRLAGDGFTPVGSSAEEFSVFIKSERLKWGKVIKTAGIKPE